jgi:hypothetical protein
VRTTMRLAAIVVASALALSVGWAAPASAANPIYYSVRADTGPYPPLVMDIRQSSHADRAQAILFAWNGGKNQRWTKRWVGEKTDGYGPGYVIVNWESQKCLDESLDRPAANGTAVYQYGCHDGPNQRWALRNPDAKNFGQLVNQYDGRCLDIDGPSRLDGAVLHVWNCYSSWSQFWNIDN